MEKYQVTIVLEIRAEDQDQAKSIADECLKTWDKWADSHGKSGWDWGISESDFRQVKRFRTEDHMHKEHNPAYDYVRSGCCTGVNIVSGPGERIITGGLHFGL